MKTIEQLAEEAGFYPPGAKMLPQGEAMLRRFAALVAERCAEIAAGVCTEAADLPDSPSPRDYRDAIRAEFPKP